MTTYESVPLSPEEQEKFKSEFFGQGVSFSVDVHIQPADPKGNPETCKITLTNKNDWGREFLHR